MKKKLSLKEIFQGSRGRLGIKEISTFAGPEKEISAINIRLIKRIPFASLKNTNSTIAILTPNAVNQLDITGANLCRQMPDCIFNNHIVFLILSRSSSIPVFLKQHIDIPIAASEFEEYYLRSLLQALVREKLQEIISLHGVLVEAQGKGILITGASGIGKTTAASRSVVKDYYWVADDVAVIKKNKQGALIAGGHKKINNYIHTEATGIIPVADLFDSGRIKMKTKLAAIIEVEKTGRRDSRITKGEKEILGIKLTCLHIDIPSTGYFNENLLKKTLRQLSKDN